MKAIETIWKGYRFRSRTEARWAVFLDALGIVFDYEPEGVILPSGPYLPDFRILRVPGLSQDMQEPVWLEVKGSDATQDEMLRCAELAKATESIVILGEGAPEAERESVRLFDHKDGDVYDVFLSGHYRGGLTIYNADVDGSSLLCVARDERELEPCHYDTQDGIEFIAAFNAFAGPVCYILGGSNLVTHPHGAETAFGPYLRVAYDKARSARFEFGQVDQRWPS